MTPTRVLRVLCAAALTVGAPVAAQDDVLRAALVNRIDVGRRGTGGVVGLLLPDGRRQFTAHGRAGAGGPPVGAGTVFEIGCPGILEPRRRRARARPRHEGGDEAGKRAAIAWINGPHDVNDLAGHAVEPGIPLHSVSAPRTAIALDAATLAEYVGSYPLVPGFTLTVTREGTQLFVQATGQPRFEVQAEKRDAFFLTAVEAQLTFTRDAGGVVTGLVLHQNGASRPAPKQP